MADRFPFVQLDFLRLLGPADGRYRVPPTEDGQVDRVIAIDTLRGEPARPRRRRPRRADPTPPPAPALTRATVIVARPLGDARQADAWLEHVTSDEERREGALEDAVRVLTRLVHAHRVASADPFVPELAPSSAVTARIGQGTGDQVANGEWTSARTIALRDPDSDPVTAAARAAAVMRGTEQIRPWEALLLRAQADVAAMRYREAALQLRLALESLLVDVDARPSEIELRGHATEDLERLRAARGAIGEIANAALRGELEPAESEFVDDLVFRARRVGHQVVRFSDRG